MQLKLNNLSITNSAEADLAFVMKLEREAAKTGSVIIWAKEEHLLAIERDNTIHMILRDKGQPVGYAIANFQQDNFELMRLVIEQTGKGYGSAFIGIMLDYAFNQMQIHRFWLDARGHNKRAIALYQHLGFITEGVLREAVKHGKGYVDVVMMSMLKPEYDEKMKGR